MSRAKLRAFEEAERVACARLRRLPLMTEAMRCEAVAHKAALEGANETFIDCLMWPHSERAGQRLAPSHPDPHPGNGVGCRHRLCEIVQQRATYTWLAFA